MPCTHTQERGKEGNRQKQRGEGRKERKGGREGKKGGREEGREGRLRRLLTVRDGDKEKRQGNKEK